MLKRWSEIGVGRHWTESVRILCPSREDYGKLQEELSLLSELTERHGTRYLLSGWRDGSALLQITVYEDLLKRNAGKRRKLGKLRRICEVYLYRQGHSAAETADYAGLLLRSYQRRVKKYKENGLWGKEAEGWF